MQKVSFLIKTSGRIVFKQMFSNITKPLDGKVAIITASTDGIGFATAKQLISEGASVMISSRKISNVEKALEKLQNEYGTKKVQGLVCHVSKRDDRSNLINETIKIFGGIDIFVSNAAINPKPGPILDCDESLWDKIFDVNVKSAFLFTKEITPHLIARGGGSIVYVSSVAGFVSFPLMGAYCVSKTALFGLTKSIAYDLAENNIRVNCIAPGAIKTKFGSIATENKLLNEHLLHMKTRFGRPEEIGTVISFLCSPSSSFITGEVIVASGGMTTRL